MAAVTPLIGRPPRADAQRNRERIVAAGREVFAEMGGHARIEEIARRAGVGVGTVYRHFETKDALMVELVAEKWRLIAGQIREELSVGGEPWDVFTRTLRRNAEVMATDAAVRHELLCSPAPEVLEAEAARVATVELTAATEALVEHCRGVLRDDLTAADVGLVMCGVAATMDLARQLELGGWRRHLELALEGMRA